jgi:hypothetical protein
VVQLDPVLLTNEIYMAPYPALAAFVGQHPDIVHHAAFYLGQPDNNDGQENPQNRAMRAFSDAVSYVTTVVGFIAFFVTIGWLARLLVDHRRWLRAAKTQTDAQAKWFDRLTSNGISWLIFNSPPALVPAGGADADRGRTAVFRRADRRIPWFAQAGIILAIVGRTVARQGQRRAEPVGPRTCRRARHRLGLARCSAAVAFGISSRLCLMELPKP